MGIDRVGDFLKFYNRYVIYVGFSVRSGSIGNNKLGKYKKWFTWPKEWFYQPAKTPQITTVTTEDMPQVSDAADGKKIWKER